jgi:DHA3 family tetracycline resistance protein-like MFS transporter
MPKKPSPLAVYTALEFSSSLIFSLIFTVNMVYQVTVVGLSPLQLVLVGTILETAVFLFEIPTGVLADVRSRKLSVVIGYVVMGTGFLLEGSVPAFWAVALSQVVWGLGYTFTSGATQAWIADEVGEKQSGDAFLRGSQAARIGGLAAIPISVWIGTVGVALPIILGGTLMILLAVFLNLAMSEEGFAPTPAGDRTTWGMMKKTVQDARQVVKRRPLLLILLGIGLFYGLYSEGFDRLWTPHILDILPTELEVSLEPVFFFGMIRGVLLLISIGATEIVRRRIDTGSPAPLARVLTLNAVLIIIGLAGFGLTRDVWVALALFWLVGAFRSIHWPLFTAWFNQRIDDPQVRATMLSMTSQVDAIGQIAGGPAVGAIGNHSIRAALVVSAITLSPVLPLYAAVMRRHQATDEENGTTI